MTTRSEATNKQAGLKNNRNRRSWTLRAKQAASGSSTSPYTYNGFISYSHAADGALAPALQRGLQRFARPWYAIRALSIFRDNESLSASPHLWTSIQDALDASEFFILLASPTAAQSPWVAKEADRWCATKPRENLLLGLTEGNLVWDERARDFDWQRTDSLPSNLLGVFDEEPRFVDLRWARSSTDLDLTHPGFREAVADLAAPLHHRPKAEIASEEVRQHRLFVLVRRLSVTALLLLLAIAIGLATYANIQKNQANHEAQVAEGRALAAEATADLANQPEQSLRLALQSSQLDPGGPGTEAMRLALAESRLRIAISTPTGSNTVAAWSPSSDLIAVTGPHDCVEIWDAASGHLLDTLKVSDHAPMTQLLFDSDGGRLAAVSNAGQVALWNLSSDGKASAISTVQLNKTIQATIAQDYRTSPCLRSGWRPCT